MTTSTDTAERIPAIAPGGARVGSRPECGLSQNGESPAGENETLGWMEKILAGGPQYILCSDRVSEGYSLRNGETVVRRGGGPVCPDSFPAEL